MPTCIVDGQQSNDTVYAIVGGQRIDMCRWHWNAWAKRNERASTGILRWLNWHKPLWRHGDADYQLLWQGGQVVVRQLPSLEVIASGSSATTVLNHLFATKPAGVLKVEPIGSNPPYPLTGSVYVKPGTRMLGCGRQSVFQASPQGSFTIGMFYLGGENEGNVTVSDIRVVGARNKEDCRAFYAVAAKNITLQNLEAYNFGWTPRSQYDSPAAILATNAGNPAKRIEGWKVVNCTVYDCDYDAVMVSAYGHIEVLDCVFAYNQQRYGEGLLIMWGGDVHIHAATARVARCVSRYCAAGVPAERYNIAGFHLRDGNAVLIDDCHSEYCGSQGILLCGCRGATTRNTTIRGVERYAGLYYEGCIDSYVENVAVRDIPNDVGIVVGTWGSLKSHGTVVNGSRVSNIGGPGIITDSSRVTIVNCEAVRCGVSNAWHQYMRAGFVVCGWLDSDSKVIRCRARKCRYGFSDYSSGAGIGRRAIVADCDFYNCDEAYYIGQTNPDYAHLIERNREP